MKANSNQQSIMRRRPLYPILIISACLGFLMAACSKMDDTYKKFLETGDIIYPGRADSLQVFPGHNRVKLSWLLTSDPSIVLCRVYWNDGADSVEMPIKRGSGVDTVSVIIDSLAEGYYNFDIYTYDKDGNMSVAADTIGQVFGQNYASTIHNRIIKNSYWDQDTAFIYWYGADKGAVGSELIYKDKNGVDHTIQIPIEDSVTKLPDYQLHEALQYQTGYRPDSMAIDTFYTAYTSKTIDDTLAIILPPYPSPDGMYTIINKLSGKVVSVEGAATGNNANINQATFTGATSQLWTFAPAATEDYYEIDNVNSGGHQAIAVQGASTDDGANILQYKTGKGGNDQWKLERVDGQYYKLICLKSQKVMEVAGSSLDEGGNIQQNTWNGGDNQLFRIAWNMALHASISDKSSDVGAGRVPNLTDGDNSTFWQVSSGDRKDDNNVWVVIDLGSSQTIDELDQVWSKGDNHIGSYTILTSEDGNAWKTAYQKSSGISAAEQASFPPAKGRYVKLSLNLKEDGNLNLAEVQVYYFPH